MEKHRFHIKAIIEAGDATDNMLIVNLEFAQHWLEKEGQATNALLNVKNDQGQVEQFATSLQQTYPDLEIRPIRKVSASEGQILEKIKGLMGLISVVILILATLCVNTTLIAIVGERAKEFALQKLWEQKARYYPANRHRSLHYCDLCYFHGFSDWLFIGTSSWTHCI